MEESGGNGVNLTTALITEKRREQTFVQLYNYHELLIYITEH